MADSDVADRLANLEAQMGELRAVTDLLVRLLSTSRPLSRVLEYYGVTESGEHALYQFLDEMVERVKGPEHVRPSFGDFVQRIGGVVPKLRGDRQFVQLIIDTLKIERPAYQELHRYMIERHWPVWDAHLEV